METIEIDLGRIFAAYWRNLGKVFLIAAVCSVLGFLIAFFFITPRYQSSVMFYVGGNSVDSALVLLETGETLDAVLTESGAARDAEQLSKMLAAKAVQETGFFRVTVTSPDAREARYIADAVARVLPQRMQEIVGSTSVKVADTAEEAENPAIPSYPKCAAMGAAFGFLLSSAEIALGEIFRPEQTGRYSSRGKRKRV